MDEGNGGDGIPDLKDIEVKIGRKTPEGLLRWMREEATSSSSRADAVKQSPAHEPPSKETGRKSLDDKIRKLKAEMAHLRSVDVKILQQLLALNEGIEAVKWLMEERSTLTSRCSSLTSSQYSLGDTSWRGSWSSLQDPNDKLDNISIGSYLDTLADDMDEYCPSSSESVICSSVTPLASDGTAKNQTAGGVAAPGVGVRSCVRIGSQENGISNGTEAKAARETGSGVNGNRGGETVPPVGGIGCPQAKQVAPVWSKASEMGKEGNLVPEGNSQTRAAKANGIVEKLGEQTGSPTRLGQKQSPKLKTCRNGKIELDTCKMNGKMHLEYDAHWRWVQSQEDVTFL